MEQKGRAAPAQFREACQPVLKSQDLYLLLAACRDRGTTYPELTEASGLSVSEVNGALKRAKAEKLRGRLPELVRIADAFPLS